MKTVERLMHSARSTDAACHHARFRNRGPSRSANSAAAEPMTWSDGQTFVFRIKGIKPRDRPRERIVMCKRLGAAGSCCVGYDEIDDGRGRER